MSDTKDQTILAALHLVLHSLQTSYARPTSSHHAGPSAPLSGFPLSSSVSVATLHPYHPSAQDHTSLPPPVSTHGTDSGNPSSASADVNGSGKSSGSARLGDMSKEELLNTVRNVRTTLLGFREAWAADRGVGPDLGRTSTNNDSAPTGTALPAESTVEPFISSERKKNALIRIMSDYCASESALLSTTTSLRDILSHRTSSHLASIHLGTGGPAQARRSRSTSPTPFLSPKTLDSPLERLVDSASKHAVSHGIDSSVNLQDPDLGMGVMEDEGGAGSARVGAGDTVGGGGSAGKEHSAFFAGGMTVMEISVGIPDDHQSHGIKHGGTFTLNRLVVEIMDPSRPDQPAENLLRAETVLRERFQSYLDVVNACRAKTCLDSDWESFSSDDEREKGSDGGEKETLALKAERAYLSFEREWLDLFAMDVRARRDGMVWFDGWKVVQKEMDELEGAGTIHPSAQITILPSFRPFPPNSRFSNPIIRLVPLDHALPIPFRMTVSANGSTNEGWSRWKLMVEQGMVVSGAFFESEEAMGAGGRVERMIDGEGGIARLLDHDSTLLYEWRPPFSPNDGGTTYRYTSPSISVPGHLVGQIGLSSIGDVGRFAQAARRSLLSNDLFRRFFQAVADPEPPSGGSPLRRLSQVVEEDKHASSSEGSELDAELDDLLSDDLPPLRLDVSVQRLPKHVSLSFPIQDRTSGAGEIEPFALVLSLRPSEASTHGQLSIKTTWSLRPTPTLERLAALSGRIEEALGEEGARSDAIVDDVRAWLHGVYTRLTRGKVEPGRGDAGSRETNALGKRSREAEDGEGVMEGNMDMEKRAKRSTPEIARVSAGSARPSIDE